jgi:endonuclease I
VDDFGIKHVGRKHAEHLKASLEKNYEISSDWTGSAYCGLKIEWDFNNIVFDSYMPGYIKESLHKFQHPAPVHPEHAPHAWNTPVYGAKQNILRR